MRQWIEDLITSVMMLLAITGMLAWIGAVLGYVLFKYDVSLLMF